MVDITDPAAVDSPLQNAPDRVNSFIILFVPYHFSTLSTLIKTLSSSGSILFINAASDYSSTPRSGGKTVITGGDLPLPFPLPSLPL